LTSPPIHLNFQSAQTDSRARITTRGNEMAAKGVM
jgi:hypothetical protein